MSTALTALLQLMALVERILEAYDEIRDTIEDSDTIEEAEDLWDDVQRLFDRDPARMLERAQALDERAGDPSTPDSKAARLSQRATRLRRRARRVARRQSRR